MANPSGQNVPMPAKLKLLKGRAPGRDSGGRVVPEGPEFERVAPEPPEWLPEEGLREWRRIVPLLMDHKLLKKLDYISLTSYCLTWDRLVNAQRDLSAHGEYVDVGPQGMKKHPLVTVIEGATRELRAWAREFGLTPSSEASLSSGDKDSENDNPFA